MPVKKRVKPTTKSPLSKINEDDFEAPSDKRAKRNQFTADKFKLYLYLKSEGKTDTEILDVTGWDRHNFDNWKKSDAFNKYVGTIDETRKYTDEIVINSLLKRCTGMKTTKVTIISGSDNIRGAYNEEKIEVADLPPNVEAAKLWLRSRVKGLWAPEFNLTDLSNSELLNLVKKVVELNKTQEPQNDDELQADATP